MNEKFNNTINELNDMLKSENYPIKLVLRSDETSFEISLINTKGIISTIYPTSETEKLIINHFRSNGIMLQANNTRTVYWES